MDVYALAFGLFLGLVLAGGDFLGREVFAKRGRWQGLACWILLVGVPAGAAGFLSVQLLGMALLFGSIIAALMEALHRTVKARFLSADVDQ